MPGTAISFRTLANLAPQQGIGLQTYLNAAPHKRAGHPAPISSEGPRSLLYDEEQVDAYLTGTPPPRPADQVRPRTTSRTTRTGTSWTATRPPPYSASPPSFTTYKHHPLLTEHTVTVSGVDHWPQSIVHRYRDTRPGPTAATGRATASGDQAPPPPPRDQLLARMAPLRDADPTITATAVVVSLDVSRNTAQMP